VRFSVFFFPTATIGAHVRGRSSQQKGAYLAFWRRASCARAIIRRGLFFLCCCCFSCAFLFRIYFVWCQSVVVFFGCCSLLLFWLCLFGRDRAFLAVTMLLGLCLRMANTITWFSPFSAVCFLFFFVFFSPDLLCCLLLLRCCCVSCCVGSVVFRRCVLVLFACSCPLLN